MRTQKKTKLKEDEEGVSFEGGTPSYAPEAPKPKKPSRPRLDWHMLGLKAEQNYEDFKGFVRAAKREVSISDAAAEAYGGWKAIFDRAKHEF